MSRVVVGVDGSAASAEALEWALDEAEAHAVPLAVVTAVIPVPTLATWPVDALYGSVTDADLDAARKAAADMVAELEQRRGRTARVEVEVTAVPGQPAHVLCRAGRDARVLVVGSRGAGGFSRLMLGSVSTAVVHHAPCPVVVIRPRGEDAADAG